MLGTWQAGSANAMDVYDILDYKSNPIQTQTASEYYGVVHQNLVNKFSLFLIFFALTLDGLSANMILRSFIFMTSVQPKELTLPQRNR